MSASSGARAGLLVRRRGPDSTSNGIEGGLFDAGGAAVAPGSGSEGSRNAANGGGRAEARTSIAGSQDRPGRRRALQLPMLLGFVSLLLAISSITLLLKRKGGDFAPFGDDSKDGGGREWAKNRNDSGASGKSDDLGGAVRDPLDASAAAAPVPAEGYGCFESDTEEACWAGVYFDHAAQAPLLLRRDSSVQAPEGAPGTLRWRRLDDRLTIADRWTGEPWSAIERLPLADADVGGSGGSAGEGSGGGSGGGSRMFLEGDGSGPRLRQDPEGFTFPGCIYAVEGLSDAGKPAAYHVTLRRDAAATTGGSGGGSGGNVDVTGNNGGMAGGAIVVAIVDDDGLRDARWTLGGAGDELEITLPEIRVVTPLRLRTADMGVMWVPAELGTEPPLTLRLVHHEANTALWYVSQPTLAMLENISPAGDGGSGGADPTVSTVTAVPENAERLKSITSVLTAQPTWPPWLTGRPRFRFLVVIAEDLPRPAGQAAVDIGRPESWPAGAGLRCHFDMWETPGVWLAWGIALCGMATKAAGVAATLRLSHGGKFITTESERHFYMPPTHHLSVWLENLGSRLVPPAPLVKEPVKAAAPPPLGAYPFWDGRAVDDYNSYSGYSDSFGGFGGGGIWGFPRNFLSVCTMFKNEGPYLLEWLEYHRRLGVGHFYLYDNGSRDSPGTIMASYIAAGVVSLIRWRPIGAQTQMLHDCLLRHRHETLWMAFVDVDEFIDPSPQLPPPAAADLTVSAVAAADGGGSGGSSDSSSELNPPPRQPGRELPDLLARMAEDGGKNAAAAAAALAAGVRKAAAVAGSSPRQQRQHTICLPWVSYCGKGQLTRPTSGGVLEAYRGISDQGAPAIHMQKPLFLADRPIAIRAVGPHFLLYGDSDLNTQYRQNLRCPHAWAEAAELQLRHYRSKSREEYVARRKGADSAYKGRVYTEERLKKEWDDGDAKCVMPADRT